MNIWIELGLVLIGIILGWSMRGGVSYLDDILYAKGEEKRRNGSWKRIKPFLNHRLIEGEDGKPEWVNDVREI